MPEPIELSARQRRLALEALSRERLSQITEHYDLNVADRRVAASHVDAIVRAKRVDFAEVLGLLGRDELKAVCEALGLDTSGREKQTLLDRVLGRSNGAAAVSRDKVAPGTGNASAAPPDPGAKLTREQLEGYLWAAADILRGSIDSSDYKNFIFGLLFLKRLSDRFDEECEQLVAEGIDPEQHDEHQFFVPKRARWSQIQKGATGLGELLNKASAALEEANAQALEGVLAGIDYNDERKLGDARQRDNVLHRLVQHFSKVNLRNDHLAEPDMLGRAYEYLIEKFADDAGKKGGEFYTPHMVVRLIVELLEPKEGMRICDPTCGSGGMLIQCRQVHRRARRTAAQLQPVRAGEEPRHLGHLQDEHAAARLPRCAHREGRRHPRPEAAGGRRADAVRPRDREPAVQPRRLGAARRRAATRTAASASACRRRPRATSRSCSTWSRRSTRTARWASSCRTACCSAARAKARSARGCCRRT